MSDYLRLKKSNCKNCYKCIRHCPVKSIRFSGNQAHIVGDECILCGHCFVVCPQNAKQIEDSTEKVKVLIQNGAPVIASIAPSFIANYEGVGIEAMEAALKKLGFFAAEETAVGATIVKKEYEKMLADGKKDIIISSCCHSANLLIQKYYPELLPYLADVVSPMQAHSLDIKKRYPGAKTVFIGPCVAKKDEAERYEGIVDAVLTFEDLGRWFESENIVPEKVCGKEEHSRARFFPTCGGIIKTMTEKPDDYTYIPIDGVENCISVLDDIKSGGLNKCFIEMSVCTGSCIGGPVMEKYHRTPVRDFKSVCSYAGNEDFITEELGDKAKTVRPALIRQKALPTEYEIKEILKKMGKTKPEDELNCGSCGYNSCREKAIAIFEGKADMSMCLPFLKDRAESFSDNIMRNTPNGIVVVNEELEIQQINKVAMEIMNISDPSFVLGESVMRILDPTDFVIVQDGRAIRDKRVYLAEYGKYVDETIVYDQEYKIIVCFLRDVTAEQKESEKKEQKNRKTVDIADEVVDKQMRIVQEIAYLLGETAAETKIALTNLKESIIDDE